MKKHAKLLICVLTMTLVVAFMPTMAFAADDVGTAKVTVGACSIEKANVFDYVTKELEVSGDTSDNLGFADTLEKSKVSFADVLYAMGKDKYGDKFTKDTAENYFVIGDTGYLSKWFGIETYNVSYTFDHKLAMAGSAFSEVKDGGIISIYGYQDASYNDVDAYFTNKSLSVTAGKKVTLKMKGEGFDESYAGKTIDIKPAEGKKIVAATVDKDGSLKDITGAEMDKDGNLVLSFDKAGTYSVSAYGTSVGVKPDTVSPISLPIVEITVKAPSIKKAAISKIVLKKGKKAKVSWKKVSGASGYELQYKKKGAKKWTQKNAKNKTGYTIKKLKKGKKYQVRVRAYKKVGKEKYYGKWSKVKTTKKVTK